MSDMVKRVACAIHEKRRKPENNKHWFNEDAAHCELSRQLAKTAIEEIQDGHAQMADQYECGLDHYPSHEARTHYEQGVIDSREGIAKAIRGETK